MKSNDNLTTICFNQIRTWILNGEFSPGEKLKGEYLKQRLESGLTPIREALSRLVATNLVDFKDKTGFSVATLSRSKVYDVFITHAKIECLLLKESIAKGDDSWEANIMGALYKLAKVETTKEVVAYKEWLNRNDEFHNALVAACNIVGLVKIRNECLQLKDWYTRLGYTNGKQEFIAANHNEHVKIAHLAIAKKTEAAATKLYQHIIQGIEPLAVKLKSKGLI